MLLKLGNMRKPQDFSIYPEGDDGKILIQSNKSIGSFDKVTGEGLLNTKGCYFMHLNTFMGAKPYTLPADILKEVVANIPKKGDHIGCGIYVG